MFSFLGGIVSGLFFKLLEAFGLIEVGKKEQAAADTAVTAEALKRERDALAMAGSAEEAARHGKF